MQSTRQDGAEPANAEENREAFWDEVRRIAMAGAEQPESLTHAEIGRICRVTLIGMTIRAVKAERQVTSSA